MYWTVSVGGPDTTDGIIVYSLEAMKAAVAGILMGRGIHPMLAEKLSRSAVGNAQSQQIARKRNHATPPLEYRQPMTDGRVITVRSSDRPEDPNHYCTGLTSEGTRCSRHLNHLGEC